MPTRSEFLLSFMREGSSKFMWLISGSWSSWTLRMRPSVSSELLGRDLLVPWQSEPLSGMVHNIAAV